MTHLSTDVRPSALSRYGSALLAYLEKKARLHTILIFTWFELRKTYAGSVAGVLWTVLVPLFQCMVYIFMFAVVLRVQFDIRPGVTAGPQQYTAYILSGLIPWLFFSSVITSGTDMVQQFSNFIRQPNFPYEIIPSVVLLLAVPAHVAGLVVLFIVLAFVDLGFGGPVWSVLILSYIFIFFALRGLATILGYATMYARDIRQVVLLIMFSIMYFSPIFYKPEQVPRLLRPLLYLNPFSYPLSCFKYGFTGDPTNAVISPAVDLAIFALMALGGWYAQRKLLLRFRSRGLDSVG